MSSLHERFKALADEWMTGPQGVPPVELVKAGYRLALAEAARECEQRWRDGYRGEVTVGFAHVVRKLAAELD